MPSAAAPPLAGLRVLDLSGRLGAYCGKALADLGAEVVKVELPPGCALRRLPLPGSRATDPGDGLLFAYYHRGQRGITLDWRRAEAVPLLAELAGTAAVILASPAERGERPAGFTESPLGLSWAPPGALVCLLSPFGLTGPCRHWRATPFTLFAMSGMMFPQGPVEGPPAAMPGQSLYDEAGLWAALLVQSVLLGPEDQRSQVIDHSAHEVALFHQLGQSPYSWSGQIKTRATNFSVPPSGIWACRDGSVDIGVHSPRQWEDFLDVVGRPDELADPMYRDRRMRALCFDVLTELIGPLLAERGAAAFVAEAQRAGVPCSLAQSPAEFARDPQARSRGFFRTVAGDGGRAMEMPGAPFVSDPPLVTVGPGAPGLGQDNEAVYLTELGHGADELARWRADGLV